MEQTKKFSAYLWVERYRPKTVKDMILPTTMKRFFTKLMSDKEIPNMLLYSSSPGSGKTSTAKAICSELDLDYLYINTSSETGIDTLRTKIQGFAATKSFNGKPKAIILDEFDGASINLQQGLRAAIEAFHNHCRFILTANYITKIIPALRSRCQEIDFNMTDKKIKDEMVPKICTRLTGLLKVEKVEGNPEVVAKIVDTFYPDIRKMISICQQYNNQNGIIDNAIFDMELVDDIFYKYLDDKDLTNARKYLIEKSYNYDELFGSLFNNYVPTLPKDKQGQAILYIADYMYKNGFVIDKEINATALLLELMSL